MHGRYTASRQQASRRSGGSSRLHEMSAIRKRCQGPFCGVIGRARGIHRRERKQRHGAGCEGEGTGFPIIRPIAGTGRAKRRDAKSHSKVTGHRFRIQSRHPSPSQVTVTARNATVVTALAPLLSDIIATILIAADTVLFRRMGCRVSRPTLAGSHDRFDPLTVQPAPFRFSRQLTRALVTSSCCGLARWFGCRECRVGEPTTG